MSLQRGATNFTADFAYMCKRAPDRIGIVAEGDSWFAYPRKWIAFGADINIIHHLEDKIANTDTTNLLRLASNGDEAVDMTSGKQFQRLYKILKRNQAHINILLFSGGGNDIVGKNDMLPLLREYDGSSDFMDCIHLDRFKQKLDSVILSYARLVALCEDVVPSAKIVTHMYDIAKPWNQGGDFFWGRLKTEPWVYPYLIRRNIPTKFHLPVIKFMLESLATNLQTLADSPITAGRLIVVHTQGTLKPGSKKDWLNEIHPTEDGFKKVFNKIYTEMKTLESGLPK